jgi:diaminopimelate decarboxylase
MRWDTAFERLDLDAVYWVDKQYGTPFILLDEDCLLRRWQEIRAALARAKFFLPYKSCPLSVVRRRLHRLGMGAEVASPLELKMALALKVEARQILLNQPLRDAGALRMAVEMGAFVVADGVVDLRAISQATRSCCRARVLMRINPCQEAAVTWMRFGLPLESAELIEALEFARDATKLEIVGIHSHLGTNIADAGVYVQAAGCLASAWKDLEAVCQHELRVLDLGGGFATPSSCPTYIPRNRWWPDSPVKVMSRVYDIFAGSGLAGQIEFWVEPGRILTEDSAVLVSRIVDVRAGPVGPMVTCDSGINHLPTAGYMRHPIARLGELHLEKSEASEYVVFGSLCMQSDVLSSGCWLPTDVKRGDLLQIGSVGAYDLAFSFPFIQGRCPILFRHRSGAITLIRRRELTEDFLSLEQGV